MQSSRQIFAGLFLALLALTGCDVALHEDAAKRLEATGDLKGAVEEYRRGVEANPSSAKAHFLLGQALLKSNDLKDAEKELREAVHIDIRSADGHLALAEVLLKRQNWTEAKSEFDVAAIYAPKSGAPLRGQGMLLEAQGDTKGAIGKYREAIKLDPDYPEAHDSLGMALMKEGDNVGARKEVETAQRLRKTSTK